MQGVRWLVRLTHHFSSLGAPNSDLSLQPKSNCGETHLIQAFEIQNVAPWDGGAGGTKKRSFFWDGGVEARRNRCCRHYSVDQLGDLNVVTALRCFSRTGVAISPGTLYAGQRSVGLLSVDSVSKM